jgi:hypothetical protein
MQTVNRRLSENIVDEKSHGIDVKNLMKEKLLKDLKADAKSQSNFTPNFSRQKI